MKNLLIGLTLSLFATVAFADDNLVIDNDSANATATNGISSSSALSRGGNDDVSVGVTLAGSVLVNSCDCYDDITIDNKSRTATARNGGVAGSTVVLGTSSRGR